MPPQLAAFAPSPGVPCASQERPTPPKVRPQPASVRDKGFTRARFDLVAQVGLIVLLAAGCWRVLSPFVPAMLFAVIVVSSTWPLFVRLRRVLWGRGDLASLLACCFAAILVLGPIFLLLPAMADGAGWCLRLLEAAITRGLPPLPGWIESLPLLGTPISHAWEGAGDPQRVKALLSYASAPAQQAALFSGRILGSSALQGFLTALLLYFLYRNGEAAARALRRAAYRLGGRFALELMHTASASVSGVMFGILGAGLAQGMVAAAGFAIAGIPNPLFLGAITFVLSVVPIGPPIVWAGAAAWLFQQGDTGWAIFMVVYGLLGISSIDNVLKPLIISRANHLPFVITLMGVVGGVLGFGMTGVFLGPTLVALAIDLGRHWISGKAARAGRMG